MQPRRCMLWSLFLGRPTAFWSWIRPSKSRPTSASCLSSGTRTNWDTVWLEETSASKPVCLFEWSVIAWIRKKVSTSCHLCLFPLKFYKNEGRHLPMKAHSILKPGSWGCSVLQTCLFFLLCVTSVWCLRTQKYPHLHHSSPADRSPAVYT